MHSFRQSAARTCGSEDCDAKRKKGNTKGKNNGGKSAVLESTRVRRLFVTRHGPPRFFMSCSVYALIQLDERKKLCKQRFNVGSLLLYPSPELSPSLSFFSSLFVLCSFRTNLNACRATFARVGMTRKLVIKLSFNLSLVIRNCQRRG